MNQQNDRLYDIRTLERNLSKGVISHSEYQAHLATLSDKSENTEPVESTMKKDRKED